MIDQVVLQQLTRDVFGVLDEPFRALHSTLWNSKIQFRNSRFTTTHSNDLRSVFQEVGKPIQSASAHIEPSPHNVIQYLMVNSVEYVPKGPAT
jgi:hypothetical protein